MLIEDSTDLAANVGEFLESRGLTVDYAYDGRTGLLLAGSNHYDVLMLDLNLPGIDGLTLCRRLREGAHRDLPVLMLTARDTECDIFMGFEAGADDYLTKPFELAILIARVDSMVRRREWLHASLEASAAAAEPANTFTFGEKTVYFDRLEIRVQDQVFPLTLMESNLLRCLIRHDGQPVSRKVMLEEVWGLHEDTDTRAIDNFVVRLRRYIERDPTQPRHLLTVRGVGYRFVAFPAEGS